MPIVSKVVVKDRQQPRTAVAIRVELIEKSIGTKDSVLKQILRIIRIAGEPQCCGINCIQMWKRRRFEPLASGRRVHWFGPIMCKLSIAPAKPKPQG